MKFSRCLRLVLPRMPYPMQFFESGSWKAEKIPLRDRAIETTDFCNLFGQKLNELPDSLRQT